jgi:hypothetical protein
MSVIWSAPATIRRAFFLTAALFAVPGFAAAPKPAVAPPLTQVGKSDPTEARALLEQVRQGIAGNYFFEFQLRVMPRRGDEKLIPGRLWGGRRENGPVTRVALNVDKAGNASSERRLLIQGGRNAALWRWDAGAAVTPLGQASPFEPVLPETDLAAFDLQMPYLYWEKFEYEGLTRFRGRPAHVFVMLPPSDFAAKYKELSGVRVFLDTQYNAMVQTETLGSGKRVLKTLSLVDLKKVGEQWIPRTFDIRDERTRNKTRFDVLAAALDIDFSRTLFEPAQLSEPVRPPAEATLTRFDQ